MLPCFSPPRKAEPRDRKVFLGRGSGEWEFLANTIRNQKYNILTFLPAVLLHQFSFFLNLYFLALCFSQLIPPLRIGAAFTYYAPLIFVLSVTLIREAIDEFRRYRRDKEFNSRQYTKLSENGELVRVESAHIKVSDLIVVEENRTVPADMVLLHTTEPNGTCFIRTDQLDGETDWKLRVAVHSSQSLERHELAQSKAWIIAEEPERKIHEFEGKFTTPHATCSSSQEESLSVKNTLWANTVVASGTAVGCVIYTGIETRSMMNTNKSRIKVGKLDEEINSLVKVCVASVVLLAGAMVTLKGFDGLWIISLFRFVILFSYIVPFSLRVSLDIGKICSSLMIQVDKQMPDTVVRSTTIPEELGRIDFLLSDKTGTLTKNEMVMKKLHVGGRGYDAKNFGEIRSIIARWYSRFGQPGPVDMRPQQDAVLALALCHNVTLAHGGAGTEDMAATNLGSSSQSSTSLRDPTSNVDGGACDESAFAYQASSPEEVALIHWAEKMGLTLVSRDVKQMKLKTPHGIQLTYQILETFPFSAERKRMGIIVKEERSQEITFLMKGADDVMSGIVRRIEPDDWLEGRCNEFASEGLRTLVVAKKPLTEEMYDEFRSRLDQARVEMEDRQTKVDEALRSLEEDLELVCLTGLEDLLQADVKQTLERLSKAGIKVWMLTGDKLETAASIANSCGLTSGADYVHEFRSVSGREECKEELECLKILANSKAALIISGHSLETCLEFYAEEFIGLASACAAVVCCRCAPKQKAQVVESIRSRTRKRTAAIGDGGNDVSMIQAADAGIGIVGKEGQQASLAADFSITKFSHVSRLLLVHGRYSYKRSAAVSQFVLHRGLIISIMQAVFSSIFYFAPVSLFQGALIVGYTSVYTTLPVLSLLLDEDVTPQTALARPELYKETRRGRLLSYKTFFVWMLVSVLQGALIIYGALVLFENEFIHIVGICFTALIVTELVMVALAIQTWHWLTLLAEGLSLEIYVASLFIIDESFDVTFILSSQFLYKAILVTLVSCLPALFLKYVPRTSTNHGADQTVPIQDSLGGPGVTIENSSLIEPSHDGESIRKSRKILSDLPNRVSPVNHSSSDETPLI